MKPVWAPLIKLSIYTIVIVILTGVLVQIIVNGRTGATNTFEAEFSDASGVTTNDNVKIAGVAVGKVSEVKVVGHGRARVKFSVDRDIAVPSDLRIAIKYQNLIGDRYLDLQRPAADTATPLRPGSLVPTSRTVPALNLTVLFGGFRPLFQALQPEEINQFAEEILLTLQGEGSTVDSLLAHTASLTNTVANRDEVIGSLIGDLNNVLGTVASRDEQLSTLVVQLQRFVTGLSEDRNAIGSAVSSIGQLTQSVTGLLTEARGPLKADIANLGGLASNLDAGKDAIDAELRVLPKLLGRVDRTASYGAWFQFFLCDVGGSIANGKTRTGLTAYSNTAERCSS